MTEVVKDDISGDDNMYIDTWMKWALQSLGRKELQAEKIANEEVLDRNITGTFKK